MALRCLLFSSSGETAEPIRQVLAGLGVEGEYCSESSTAAEKITRDNFHIVIIDWDQQPESGQLLTAARDRKAAERPLTLAIVSDDASVPQALQAGANSILRKPLVGNQVNDVLTTARDLLRAKQESAAAAAQAAAAGASQSASGSTTSATAPEPKQKPPQEFEIFQFSPTAAAPQFAGKPSTSEGEWSQPETLELKAVTPPAAQLPAESPAPSPAPPQSEPEKPRGLEWYLKTRAGASSTIAESPAPASEKPELMGFDQSPARPTASARSSQPAADFVSASEPIRPRLEPKITSPLHEQKKEAELFAYMAGQKTASEDSPQATSRLGKRAIVGALFLAGCAILAAPQAPWHSKIRSLWGRGQQATRTWLNPQPVTTPTAPVSHENFARAGDEYKLPVGEAIPDATTDPSQIQVVPMVDPTVKKNANPNAPVGLPDAVGLTPVGPTPEPQVLEKQPDPAPVATPPNSGSASVTAPSSAVAPASPVSTPTQAPAIRPTTIAAPSVSMQPAASKAPPTHSETSASNVPSSLKSQLASMTPESSGNKAPETALPSIEPVSVSEATERALLTEQPALAYPATAKGQQGTVVLAVLVGRDGTIQDAKFLQGSLAFARNAIDGVKQWKFKPYIMNGRPVSVQTSLTVSFKPISQ